MKGTKRVIGILLGVAVAGVLVVAGLNRLVWLEGSAWIVDEKAAPEADAILVLGAFVLDETPSTMLADRLRVGLSLFRAHRAPRLLLSGDHGRDDYDEVNAMRLWLEARGVPTEAIFTDHAGFNTYDSMYRARDVFQVRRLIVVTQGYHLARALFLARRLGLEAVGVAADQHSYQWMARNHVREAAARVKAVLSIVTAARPTFLGRPLPITGDGRTTRG